MVKETFWKSGVAPKDFEIPCALTIGGNDSHPQEISSLRLSGKTGLALRVLDRSTPRYQKRTTTPVERRKLFWLAPLPVAPANRVSR